MRISETKSKVKERTVLVQKSVYTNGAAVEMSLCPHLET
jgi:hypothetical protein